VLQTITLANAGFDGTKSTLALLSNRVRSDKISVWRTSLYGSTNIPKIDGPLTGCRSCERSAIRCWAASKR
jgi:hypothetical protein